MMLTNYMIRYYSSRTATALSCLAVAILASAAPAPAAAQTPIADTLRTSIDEAITDILAKTGAPSASIAVVVDGRIAYTQAYGKIGRASCRERV